VLCHVESRYVPFSSVMFRCVLSSRVKFLTLGLAMLCLVVLGPVLSSFVLLKEQAREISVMLRHVELRSVLLSFAQGASLGATFGRVRLRLVALGFVELFVG